MSASSNKFNMGIPVFFAIFFFFVIGITLLGPGSLRLKLFFVLPIIALIFLMFMKMRPTRIVETWAHSHQLTYAKSVPKDKIFERIRVNPKKLFFTPEKFLKRSQPSSSKSFFRLLTEDTLDIPLGPYVEGIIEGRHVWFYPMFDKLIQKNQEVTFYGWCMEFETHALPLHVFVSKKFISRHDTHDTESNEFERVYRVKADAGSPPLQLLDPSMMHLILGSNISSLEFSDSSLVITNIAVVPPLKSLDAMLSWGLKIASQVDRNFPVSKS